MGWLDTLQSFADGTLVEDTIKRIDEGLGQVESFIAKGDEGVVALVDTLENGARQVIDGADKAIETTGRVADVIEKKLPTN